MKKTIGISLCLLGFVAAAMEPNIAKLSLGEIFLANAIQGLVIIFSIGAGYWLLKKQPKEVGAGEAN